MLLNEKEKQSKAALERNANTVKILKMKNGFSVTDSNGEISVFESQSNMVDALDRALEFVRTIYARRGVR